MQLIINTPVSAIWNAQMNAPRIVNAYTGRVMRKIHSFRKEYPIQMNILITWSLQLIILRLKTIMAKNRIILEEIIIKSASAQKK